MDPFLSAPFAVELDEDSLAFFLMLLIKEDAIMEQPDFSIPGPGPGTIFTLTLRVDTIQTQANNAIFNAPLMSQVATLQTGDSITNTGAAGALNAVFNPVALNLIGAAIHGVSTWNLTNLGTWGAPQWIAGGSLVTNVLTLNAINSNAPLAVGVTGAALSHALTAVALSNTTSDLSALITPSALSGGGNTLAVNLHNAGRTNAPSALTVGPDSNVTNGYETWHINTTGDNWVTISQGSATSATSIIISGTGNLHLFGNNGFPNLVTINDTSTGTLTLSGF